MLMNLIKTRQFLNALRLVSQLAKIQKEEAIIEVLIMNLLKYN